MRSVPIWWLLLMALELALVGHLNAGELVVAAATALAAALLARAAVRSFAPPWHTPAFVGQFWWLPVDLCTDTVRLLVRTLTGRGERQERTLAVPEDRCEVEERLAHAVLLVSTSPGTYVVDVSDDESTLHLHSLVPPGRIERGLATVRRGSP